MSALGFARVLRRWCLEVDANDSAKYVDISATGAFETADRDLVLRRDLTERLLTAYKSGNSFVLNNFDAAGCTATHMPWQHRRSSFNGFFYAALLSWDRSHCVPGDFYFRHHSHMSKSTLLKSSFILLLQIALYVSSLRYYNSKLRLGAPAEVGQLHLVLLVVRR